MVPIHHQHPSYVSHTEKELAEDKDFQFSLFLVFYTDHQDACSKLLTTYYTCLSRQLHGSELNLILDYFVLKNRDTTCITVRFPRTPGVKQTNPIGNDQVLLTTLVVGNTEVIKSFKF